MEHQTFLGVFASDAMPDRYYEFPIPPTLNHYLGYNGKNRYYTAEAKKFRKLMLDVLREQDSATHDGGGMIEGYIGVVITFVVSTYRSFDVDNRLKVLLDAMQQKEYKIFADDNAIQAIYAQKFIVADPNNAEYVLLNIYKGERFGFVDPRNAIKNRR